VLDVLGVENARDPGRLRRNLQGGCEGDVQRLPVVFSGQGDAGTLRRLGGDGVHIRLDRVDFRHRLRQHDVTQADAGRVTLGVIRQVAEDDALNHRQRNLAGGRDRTDDVPVDDIGIGAVTADVLADFVHDQDVDSLARQGA
jgi:hypothetical protein